jgi:cell division protein FtsW (lipid II flippase)
MTIQRESRLLFAAAIFLFLFSLILSLSPSVRERSFDVDYRLSHWIGFALWLIVVVVAHQAMSRHLPDHDPYLFPAAALLSGWGMLTIWRLDTTFGLRQSIWLTISVSVFILGLRLPNELTFLRRYKYLLLTGSILLTAFTLIFGTNPGGFGPRLWLGCCGIYFQPSEPLKLLLVVYLASYLANRTPVRVSTIIFLPSVIVTGIALLILIIQRDLGTASIFILIYTMILFLATGKRRVLLISAAALALAGLVGYFFIDIIQIRINSWINPWDDPSGHSYQIIQSLLAIANGGTFGRGPGIGSPGLVPVAISDFIFTAIGEETGLAGTLGLIGLLSLILARGLTAAYRAPDQFRRLLAGGIVAYLGIQSLLIIGGNLRLLPLTGVTLPFVSYGGSSLLTSFVALLFFLKIGCETEVEPAALTDARPFSIMAGLLGLGLIAASLTVAWWAIIRSPDLLTRTDNGRRSISDRYVPRGQLLDRSNTPLNITQGVSGEYQRAYLYPQLAPVTGYTNPVFGQAGLEATLDEYLRGLQGNPSSLITIDYLLYGTPPPGLDVRLSIDLPLQQRADELLGGHKGTVILLNAQNGEILVMASHPTYDPNQLDDIGTSLVEDADSPLVNRAAQGLYPPGDGIKSLFTSDLKVNELYKQLGFYTPPNLLLPVAPVDSSNTATIRVSPLQMALAAAALSDHGMRPAPRIALAVNTPQQGWVILNPLSEPVQALTQVFADAQAVQYIAKGQPYWEQTSSVKQNKVEVNWYLAGTPSDWQGAPLTVVVLLEDGNINLAQKIGSEVLRSALNSSR